MSYFAITDSKKSSKWTHEKFALNVSLLIDFYLFSHKNKEFSTNPLRMPLIGFSIERVDGQGMDGQDISTLKCSGGSQVQR